METQHYLKYALMFDRELISLLHTGSSIPEDFSHAVYSLSSILHSKLIFKIFLSSPTCLAPVNAEKACW